MSARDLYSELAEEFGIARSVVKQRCYLRMYSTGPRRFDQPAENTNIETVDELKEALRRILRSYQ